MRAILQRRILLLAAVLIGVVSPLGCAHLPQPAGPWGPSDRAPLLLDSEDRDRLVIELDQVDGAAPRPRSLQTMLLKMAFYLDKPGGIELVIDEVIPADQWEEKGRSIRRLARKHRSVRRPVGRTAMIHLLYGPSYKGYRGYTWTRASMDGGRGVYDAPLLVLLTHSIKPYLWITGVRQEASVLVHELGHALGLATDPGHSNEDHCTNGWCLMYNGVDARTALLYFWPTLLKGYLPMDYCEDCRDDLYPETGGVPPGEEGP